MPLHSHQVPHLDLFFPLFCLIFCMHFLCIQRIANFILESIVIPHWTYMMLMTFSTSYYIFLLKFCVHSLHPSSLPSTSTTKMILFTADKTSVHFDKLILLIYIENWTGNIPVLNIRLEQLILLSFDMNRQTKGIICPPQYNPTFYRD